MVVIMAAVIYCTYLSFAVYFGLPIVFPVM